MLDKMILSSPMAEMLLFALFMMTELSPEKKRTNIVRKLLVAICLFIAVTILEWYLVDFDTASTAFEGLFCIIAAFLYGWIGMGFPLLENCYCTIWSYLITTIGMQIVMPLSVILGVKGNYTSFVLKELPLYLLVVLVCTTFVNKILVPELLQNGKYHVSRQKIMPGILDLGLFAVLSNYQVIFWMLGFVPEEMSRMVTIFRLVVGLAAIGVLLLQNSLEKKQHAEQELDMIQQLWYRQQDQYRLSQENIDLINRKCHDLKHQMSAIRHMKDDEEINRQLKEMEHSVMIYDSVVKTGNPVLDTVLTEKCLYCEEHQIEMTCMADGSHLDFIDKVDLYTMFGNAIDNAVESVMKLTEKEKRVIQVSVFNEKNLLMIRVKNHCEGKLKFVDGLPITTKKDKGYHGFGLKSMEHTAEKYDGTVVCQQLGNAFVLQILLPIPQIVTK